MTRGALHFKATPAALIKTSAALALGGAALYCLHTGQRDRSLNRLVWAVILVLGSLAVFAL